MGCCVLKEGFVKISNDLEWWKDREEEKTTRMGKSRLTNYGCSAIVHDDRIIWVPSCFGVRIVLGFGVHEVWVEPKPRLDRNGRLLDDIFLGGRSGKYPKNRTVFHAILPQSQAFLYHQSSLPAHQPKKQNFQIIFFASNIPFQPEHSSPKSLM